MKKKMFCILTVLLAVFLVISAVPEGSAQIQDEENKDLKDEDKEVSPTQEETAEIPTLSIGDSWTYHQDLWSNKSGDEFVHTVEQITYTVSAIETYEYKGNSYYGYNLTLDGEVLDGEGSDGTVDFQINSGQVTGYLFLRMSDLGTVVDYQWRKMDGEAMGVEMTTWQETHVHENPVVETHDYPIRLGGNFYANTTKDSESYVKVVVGGQEMQNETTEENNTLYQETTVSSSIEQVSPPAGTFDTFELNRTISGDNEGYVQKNYAAAVKNTVKERADLNNTDWHRDLLTFNVTNRSSSMALSPSAGVPGNEVVVSGTFPDNASEDVRIWMPETGDEYLTSTDSEGKFNQSITVPDTSDRTPSPGENESIGVIAELKNNPTATYEVSTLEITEEPMAVSVNINDPAEGDVISKTNVTVKWSSQNAATHEVKIDEGTWDDVGTDTEHTFTGLSEGMHTVQVKAVGSGGDNATDSVSFEVNTTAPTVDITDPAEGEVFSTSEVTVSWTSDNTDYHEIRLDGGTWEDVSGNTSHTFDLEDGEHTVEVMATGGQGNNDTDNVSFLVDTTPPEINILQPAEGDTFNVTEVLVEWEGTPEGTAIEYYETSIDEGAWEDVGTDTERTFTGLSDGDHMVEVKGTDEAGNSGYEAVNFTIETEEKKANITVSDFSVSPLEGYAPLDVNITGEIENTGSAEGTVNLTIDGQNIDSWTVGAGGTETVDKTHEFQEIGNHTISIGDQSETVTVNEEEPGEADIQVNSFDVNRTEGEVPFEVEITGEIENVGDAAGSINLTIEGDIIDSWTLSAGENRSIEIIHNFEQTGNYTVELGDRSETITASQTDDDGTDDGSDDGTDNGTDDTSDNESDGGDDSPGFTLPVLAMAMTLVLLVYRIKKDKR